jgi:hypothetical protein
VTVTETGELTVPVEPGFTVEVSVVEAVVLLMMLPMAIESAPALNVHAVAPAPPPRVIVATLELPDHVPTSQVVVPFPVNVTVGTEVGTVKPVGKVMTIPAAFAFKVADGVNPTVQVVVAPAAVDPPTKETLETVVTADATPTPMTGATSAPSTSAGRKTRSTLASPREWRGTSPAERSSGLRPSGADMTTRPKSRCPRRREEMSAWPNGNTRSENLIQYDLQMPRASETPHPDDQVIVLKMGLGFATSSPTKLQATKVVRRINACPC